MKAILALALVAVIAAACGGGGNAKPTATTETTRTADVRETGIREVDAVIAAAESGDLDALVSLMHFTKVPCTATPAPTSAEYIHCPTGQPDGSPADALLVAACEGTSMVNADGPAGDLRGWLGALDRRVYAVYRADKSYRVPDFPVVNYAVVFTHDLDGHPAGLALLVGPTGLVGIDVDCGYSPQQLAQQWGDPVLPPQPPGD